MKWKIGLTLVLVIVGASIWYILDSLHSPGESVLSASQKNKALVSILGRSAHLVEEKTSTTWSVHKSQYIQFSYPTQAKIYSSDNAKAIKNGDSLDTFTFALLDERVTGAVNVISFSGTKLSEYPGVSLRLIQKDIYIPNTSATDSAQSVGFTKKDDKIEKTVFFFKNGNVVSIAVTGYNQTSVDALFTPLLDSLKLF